MRVAFVIGPTAPGRCGVGDYTHLLAAAMKRLGVQAEVFESKRRAAVRSDLSVFRPDITHLQYPTAGFGKGIAAQLLSLATRFVITLHEVEGTHFLRRLSLYPLWLRAAHVIFTCESNKQYSLAWAPWLRNISSVVPLASNIPVVENVVANGRRRSEYRTEVIHFGLVRPNKGIEDVLEFARLARDHQLPFRVSIVGSCPEKHADYLAAMQERSANLPVAWDLNLSSQAVAERLAGAAVAYMPFPDGASERHASILAALGNGLPVITTKGKFTPTDLEHVVKFCTTPAEAIGAATDLLRGPEVREVFAGRAIQYAAKLSWESIAESHISIYERVKDISTRRN